MLRRGLSTDDQATLFAAEQRARQVRSGLRVGQVPTRMALAFYSAKPSEGFYPRITRPLEGAAAVVHCKGNACARWCAASAAAAAGQPYQLFIASKAEDNVAAGIHVLRGPRECARALPARKCPFAVDYEGGGTAGSSAMQRSVSRAGSGEVFPPTIESAVHFDLADMNW